MKLNEQIAYFRKEKGMTQEELANHLGVTGQAVSKWESGQCCPDVALLPTLADIFAVRIDTLMGRQSEDSFAALYETTQSYLSSIPETQLWRDAFRLSILLHEAICTDGYRTPVPWSTAERYGMLETLRKWGMSARTESEGCAVYAGCGILLTNHSAWEAPSLRTLRTMANTLGELSDLTTLRVLYALFALTKDDFDSYVPASAIARTAELPLPDVEKALSHLEVSVLSKEGELTYRLDGCSAWLPELLEMLMVR